MTTRNREKLIHRSDMDGILGWMLCLALEA